jgi:hypothetical protein
MVLTSMRKLEEVEALLELMVNKYRKQMSDTTDRLKRLIKQGEDRVILLPILRKNRVLRHYLKLCYDKLENIHSRKLALESLGISQMQVEALKASSKAFATIPDMDKITRLQDSIQEKYDDLMEVNAIISEGQLSYDDDELEAELNSICSARMDVDVVMDVVMDVVTIFPEVPIDEQRLLSAEVSERVSYRDAVT